MRFPKHTHTHKVAADTKKKPSRHNCTQQNVAKKANKSCPPEHQSAIPLCTDKSVHTRDKRPSDLLQLKRCKSVNGNEKPMQEILERRNTPNGISKKYYHGRSKVFRWDKEESKTKANHTYTANLKIYQFLVYLRKR